MPRKLVRLKDSGHLDGESKVSDDKSRLDKPCLLVYEGDFESMDGPVKITGQDIEKLAANHNKFLKKLSRLASGEVHPRHNPPLQLDHSTKAADTIGRLVGDLSVGEHETEDGKKVKALMGTARVLGKENVEKVEDGRWVHLSGGFDLDDHKVSELTVTPFPAAGDAHMLSRMAEPIKFDYKDQMVTVFQQEQPDKDSEQWVWETDFASGICPNEAEARADAKKTIDIYMDMHPDQRVDFVKMSKEDAAKSLKLSKQEDPVGYKSMKEKMDLYAKAKKHLMDEKKMSDEDSDKHLEAAKDEELTAMAAEHDKHLKHLADEKAKEDEEQKKKDDEAKKNLTSLSAHKPKLIQLSKDMRATGDKVRLAEKTSKITTRLARLRSERKVSPAEVKAMNVSDLAGKSDEVIEATLSAFEAREHIVDAGLIGTTKAMTPSQLQSGLKKLNMDREEMQTRLNMPSKRADAEKRLADIGKQEADLSHQLESSGSDEDRLKAFDMVYDQYRKLSGEGKDEEAKEHLRAYCKTLGAPPPGNPHESAVPVEESQKQMSALASDYKKLQDDFVELVKLAAPAFGATDEDLK